MGDSGSAGRCRTRSPAQRAFGNGLQNGLPQNSAPYTSTIVCLCGKETQGLRDWNDLAKPGISVITTNPRLRRRARNYLAGLGLSTGQKQVIIMQRPKSWGRHIKNVAVLDSARAVRDHS